MNKIIRLIILSLIIVFLLPSVSSATELSIFAGTENGGQKVLGLYGNWGFLPFISSEGEYSYNYTTLNKSFAIGVSGKFKISFFAPFARAGIGLRAEEFSYSGLHFFYYIGGGLKFYVAPILGLKAGLTIFNEKSITYNRFYVGVFVEI
jgi:hypothetical protein